MNPAKRLQVLINTSVVLIISTAFCSGLAFHFVTTHQKIVNVSSPRSLYKVADTLAPRPNSVLVSSTHTLKVLSPTLGKKRTTFALNACPTANDAVVKRLQKQSVAILIHINNTSGKQQCTLGQIVQAYGRPNASTTLSGTITKPVEVLLYYDDGPGKSGPLHPISSPQAPATVVPISLATIPKATCATKTVLSFVAHEDDDILFMNPDHNQAIRSGACLRTVFLTAGDDGLSRTYWSGREKGIEAAYDFMLGHGSSLWIERYIMINNHEYIKMASPRNNASITLIFINLPDGNVAGNGFSKTNHESLARLQSGAITNVHSADAQSAYTRSELINLLLQLMQYYHPGEINTQAPTDEGSKVADHSDHKATGQLTAAAYSAYAQGIPLKYYIGYPISLLPQNVFGQDLTDKTAGFKTYTPYDSQICSNKAECPEAAFYLNWITRQYLYTPGQPVVPPSASTVTPVPSPASSAQPTDSKPQTSTSTDTSTTNTTSTPSSPSSTTPPATKSGN